MVCPALGRELTIIMSDQTKSRQLHYPLAFPQSFLGSKVLRRFLTKPTVLLGEIRQA